jgi:hypothetical protein
VTARSETVDFGAPAAFGAHTFRVEIPLERTGPVELVEDFGYQGGDSGTPYDELRALVPRGTWTVLAEAARHDFNDRLKAQGLATGRWKVGTTKIDRLLGKELCVLAWASEQAHETVLPIICTRWAALRPEERWWLFSMTVAEAGVPEDFERGWRVALRAALRDGERTTSESRRKRPKSEPRQLLLLRSK